MKCVRELFFVFLLLSSFLSAHGFLLGDVSSLDPKMLGVVDKIGSELLQKTGISLYLLIKDSKSVDRIQRQDFAREQTALLKGSYFVIFIAPQDHKIDFLMSGDLQGVVKVDALYQDFMVPFLPVKKSDVMDKQRLLAIALNGYAHFADAFASARGVVLEGNIINKHEEFLAGISAFVMKLMLISLVVLMIFVYYKARKK
ncbi:putative inner membrane protein [Helicobacter mustelae]|uniref:hypothetical protein n=1 Tax=Helicobacter mustelae TaxID=217 RepID=UPI0003220C26|nr:hypothetical protein [Helicobacter mustelae]SQH71890.1 putative inner membrane protein [Helicobacter mustelae]STP13030.1 putative inner membrane protein [Helicobacter mustelae]